MLFDVESNYAAVINNDPYMNENAGYQSLWWAYFHICSIIAKNSYTILNLYCHNLSHILVSNTYFYYYYFFKVKVNSEHYSLLMS